MKSTVILLMIMLCFLSPPFLAQDLHKVEYFFDTDQGVGMGTKVDVTNSDTIIDYTFSADISSLPIGFHKLYVRVLSDAGLFSLQESRPFYILEDVELEDPPKLTSAEYFYNEDPGIGQGNAINLIGSTDNLDKVFGLPSTGLNPGFHKLYIRLQDSTGNWTLTEGRSLYLIDPSSETQSINISAIEYFFDTDPGIENGTPLLFSSVAKLIEEDLNIPLDQGLEPGFHKLFIRVRDTVGYWSLNEGRPLYVNDTVEINALELLSKIEVFFGEDPGTGNGYIFPISPLTNEIDLTVQIDLTGRTLGNDTIYVRIINSNGTASKTTSDVFIIEEETSTENNEVLLAAYPNPASTYVRIDAPYAIEAINIYSAQGVLVKSYLANQRNTYDISDLSNGLYLLKIFYGDQIFITKMIKN